MLLSDAMRDMLQPMDQLNRSLFCRVLCCVACVLWTSACATSYRPAGFGGGYKEDRLSEDSWRVSFSGNVYTEAAQVRSYMLRRCAQLAQDSGYAYFTVGSESHQRQVTQSGTEPERSDLEQQTIDGYSLDKSSRGIGPSLVVQPQRLDRHTDSCLMHGFKTGTQPAGALEAAALLALPLGQQVDN